MVSLPGKPSDPSTIIHQLPTLFTLSDQHPHERDQSIQFVSDTHSYLVHGARTEASVTGLVHVFAQEFHAQTIIATMKSGANWPRAGYLRPRPVVVANLWALGGTEELIRFATRYD